LSHFCTACGERARSTARFCHACGTSIQRHHLPASQTQGQLSSYQGMRELAGLFADQQAWLRHNTLLEPLQRLFDHINLRSHMEEATELQKEQLLAGYQMYTSEQVEQVIDHIRNTRRHATAMVDLDIEQRRLSFQDEITEREHRRTLERMEVQHRHEQALMELRTQLELVNAVIQSFNRLQMVQLESQVGSQAELQQMQMLGQIIRQSFTALAEIDASLINYAQRINGLDIENLQDSESFALVQQLVEAITDRITKGVTQFGER